MQDLSFQLTQGDPLKFNDQLWLRKLGTRYGLEPAPIAFASQEITILLKRVDSLPEALVLIQAAKESGWGSSRFAVEANNIFGQWCYQPGCGLIPTNRATTQRHEIATYNTIRAAVDAYYLNINTYPIFLALRTIRAQLRTDAVALTARDLTEGLLYYSERRQGYIDEINQMIHDNRNLLTTPM